MKTIAFAIFTSVDVTIFAPHVAPAKLPTASTMAMGQINQASTLAIQGRGLFQSWNHGSVGMVIHCRCCLSFAKVTGENSFGITGAMNNMNDDQLCLGERVIDNVALVKMRS